MAEEPTYGLANNLTVLFDALAGVVISDAERSSLSWLAGFETHTVVNIAAVISRARGSRCCPHCPGSGVDSGQGE